uniref:Uncharacterized protein n=1 Tax=Physcomitrium patens TaxID=3218 RepID=A0A2K1K467_PHYPA|nr:hypothetical protein PHYPA_013044 [Physcomitrium patens]
MDGRFSFTAVGMRVTNIFFQRFIESRQMGRDAELRSSSEAAFGSAPQIRSPVLTRSEYRHKAMAGGHSTCHIASTAPTLHSPTCGA